MPDSLAPQLIVGGLATIIVVVCIVVHYEVMSWSSRLAPRLRVPRRARVTVVISAMTAAHVLEVWIFAAMYWLLDHWPALGALGDNGEHDLLDCVYFSVTTFTTLGFGDIVPSGGYRVMVGAEALAGLGLITWSASFTFLEMQRDWREFWPLVD